MAGRRWLVTMMTAVACGAVAQALPAQDEVTYRYVGVAACVKCHHTEKSGNQQSIWEQSGHAKAYATLQTPAADSIARARGLSTRAAESPTCLGCHTTGGPTSGVPPTEGVGCEACHNAGSQYKATSTMRSRARSVAAGMRDLSDPKAREALCRSCHNAKSPTTRVFDYDSAWAKIRHLVPKDS